MKTPVSVMQLMVLEMEDEHLIPKFKRIRKSKPRTGYGFIHGKVK